MNTFKSVMISNDLAYETLPEKSFAKTYHINTKHSDTLMAPSMYKSRLLVNSGNFSETISLPEKSYPTAEKSELMQINYDSDALTKSLSKRRSSITLPQIKKMDLETLSYLCWANNGKNLKGTRTAPSGGALYPCETYVISLDTELERGIYHYRPDRHCLEKININVPDLNKFLMMTEGFEYSSTIFVTTVVFNRTMFKYGDRGYRYALIEAGAMSQNLSLMATNKGWTATLFGGTSDVKLEKILGIDGISESIINCVLLNSDKENN